MRRTTARSSELRVNGAAVLLLLLSAALAAWALLSTPDGSGIRVHAAQAARAGPREPGCSVNIGAPGDYHGPPRARPHDAIEISRADGTTHAYSSVTGVERTAAGTPRRPVAAPGPRRPPRADCG